LNEFLESWKSSRSFRDQDGNLISNAFISDAQVEVLMSSGKAQILSRTNSATLIVDRTDFDEVYFSAKSYLELESAISEVKAKRALVVELVHKPPIDQPLIDAFLRNGFRVRRELIRLALAGKAEHAKEETVGSSSRIEITLALTEDASRIQALLLDEFDKYSERLPSIYEIEASISNEEIFIARDLGQSCGLIWFTNSTHNTHLRFITVFPRFRGSGVGKRLMKFMVSHLGKARRIDLWVVSDNQRAINMYSKLGFVRDGLASLVLLKEKSE
jgi:ribosomal protein S18 acetylase RimI-like enzyme